MLNNNINKTMGLCLINPWHFLATGFLSGLSPIIPGTIGSIVAIPFWWFMKNLPISLYLFLVLISIIIGIYICHRTAHDMNMHDHGSIVWDEFIGIWITLIAIPKITCQWIMVGFFIFRIIDIYKPWPICWIDKNIRGGLGIIMDDIIAGIISAVVLYVLGFIFLCS